MAAETAAAATGDGNDAAGGDGDDDGHDPAEDSVADDDDRAGRSEMQVWRWRTRTDALEFGGSGRIQCPE